jgi:hypothetical protein
MNLQIWLTLLSQNINKRSAQREKWQQAFFFLRKQAFSLNIGAQAFHRAAKVQQANTYQPLSSRNTPARSPGHPRA